MLDGLDNRIFELESFIGQNKGNVPRNRANILGKRTRSSKNQAELSQKCKEFVAEMDDLKQEYVFRTCQQAEHFNDYHIGENFF